MIIEILIFIITALGMVENVQRKESNRCVPIQTKGGACVAKDCAATCEQKRQKAKLKGEGICSNMRCLCCFLT